MRVASRLLCMVAGIFLAAFAVAAPLQQGSTFPGGFRVSNTDGTTLPQCGSGLAGAVRWSSTDGQVVVCEPAQAGAWTALSKGSREIEQLEDRVADLESSSTGGATFSGDLTPQSVGNLLHCTGNGVYDLIGGTCDCFDDYSGSRCHQCKTRIARNLNNPEWVECSIHDLDADGVGDEFDPCPMSPSTSTCDEDSDGVPDHVDNCPRNSNADQLDSDSDGHGDVCDACPYISSQLQFSGVHTCRQRRDAFQKLGCLTPANEEFVVSLDGFEDFDAYCVHDFDNGGWMTGYFTDTTWLHADEANVIRQGNWDTYTRTGYGNLNPDEAPLYWLPLKNWFALSHSSAGGVTFREEYRTSSSLRTAFATQSSSGGCQMTGFTLFNETETYPYGFDYSSISGCSSVFSLSRNRVGFTTLDRDNDRSGSNCAIDNIGANGGYWYEACYQNSALHNNGNLYRLNDNAATRTDSLRVLLREDSLTGESTFVPPTWQTGVSCKFILSLNESAVDGVYYIPVARNDGPVSYIPVYCDMTNGGWMLLAAVSSQSDAGEWTGSTFSTLAYEGLSAGAPATNDYFAPLWVLNSLLGSDNMVQERTSSAPDGHCVAMDVAIGDESGDFAMTVANITANCTGGVFESIFNAGGSTFDAPAGMNLQSESCASHHNSAGFWFAGNAGNGDCSGKALIDSTGAITSASDGSTVTWSQLWVIPTTPATTRSCKELLDIAPTTPSGVYVLDIDGETITTYCDMTTDGGGWTLFARSQQSGQNAMAAADRAQIRSGTWDDYTSTGFGHPDGTIADLYWAPLSFWHLFTSTFPSNQFAERTSESSGNWCSMQNFVVFEEFSSKPYGMDYSSQSGCGSGPFPQAKNTDGFTTVDRDNDHWPQNCARDNIGDNGGFWYSNCYQNSMLHSNGHIYPFRKNGGSGGTVTLLEIWLREN